MTDLIRGTGDDGKNRILSQLFVLHGKLMYHQAKKILNDPFLAEDAVQSAFEKLEKYDFRLESLTGNQARSFLVIVARNCAIGIYNAKKKQAVPMEDDDLGTIPDQSALPLDMIIDDECIARVEKLIRSLGDTYADVLMLKYFSDYTTEEIATLLDLSEQAVRVRIFRGRKMLMERLRRGIPYDGQAAAE